MIKMEICSDSEDKQISKLNESSLIAYRIQKAGHGARLGFEKFKSNKSSFGGGNGTKVFRPASKEASSATNRLSEPLVQDHCEVLLAPSSLIPESLLRKKGANASQAPMDPAALSKSGRLQAPSKDAKAATARSDGESHEGRPQRSPSLIRHRDVLSQFAKGAARTLDSSSQPQVLPKNSHSLLLPRLIELYSKVAGQGLSSEILGATAARQVTREDLLVAEEKDSSGRSDSREDLLVAEEKDSSGRSDSKRGSNTFKGTPPNPTPITRLGKGLGTIPPTGADPQGPSSMDYSLELEAEFPQDMVLKMQGNAAKKAHRTMIDRTLGGRATFKALHECLKLHLPTSFTSTMLLTRGYFLILFENEEGAIATRKLTTVDLSGLSLSFSRFSPDFDSSA